MHTNKIINLVFSAFISIIVSFASYTFYLSNNFTPSFKALPFVEQLPLIYSSLLGSLIGGFFLSTLVIFPAIQNIITKISDKNASDKIDYTPETTQGVVSGVSMNNDTKIIEVNYKNITKSFSYPSNKIKIELHAGQNITVHFNPNKIDQSYLDFYSSNASNTEGNNALTNGSLKILEINPKFEQEVNLFEVIGELYTESISGKKASFSQVIAPTQIALLIPGQVLPCQISSNNDEITISISLDQSA